MHEVDTHVGNRLRTQRKHLKLSQSQLGDALGVTFQQVQKYERGTNRVSASRLYEAARVLGVSMQFFFDGLPQSDEEQPSERNELLLKLQAIPYFDEIANALVEISAIQPDAIRSLLNVAKSILITEITVTHTRTRRKGVT